MTANQQASDAGGAGRHRAARPQSRLARWGKRLFASVDRALFALEIRTFPHHLIQTDVERVESMEDVHDPECDECQQLGQQMREAKTMPAGDRLLEVRHLQIEHEREVHGA